MYAVGALRLRRQSLIGNCKRSSEMLDIMQGSLATYNLQAVAPDTSLDQLCRTMEKLEVRYLPVVDGEHRVVGLVSRRDLARTTQAAAKLAAMGKPISIANKPVEQFMSRQVLTLERAESPEVALRAMVTHGFHCVPITEDGQLVAIVTSSDFLRELSYGEWAGFDEPVIRRLCAPGQTVEADEPLSSALKVAESLDQEFVVVVRKNRPLGILSHTAMQLCLYGGNGREAAELQTAPVHTVLAPLPMLAPDYLLKQAALLMLEHRARALPVIDRSRVLLGILREDDILRTMAERLEE